MTKIVIVGEAWGAEEEKQRMPFVGPSGYELTRMLSEAGIHRADCFLTNVFNLRPPGNKIEDLCGPKAEGIKGVPALVKGKYVPERYTPELERLADEIIEHDPNLIICLGNTPTWALCLSTGISKLRGTTCYSSNLVTGYKCLPTYHPAAVLRQWELRPIVVIDLTKARREAEFPEIRRPKRKIFIPETVEDIYEFDREYIARSKQIAVDIETAGQRVTCLGIAPGAGEALVIPFTKPKGPSGNYWKDVDDDCRCWHFIRTLLARPVPKIFQNGLYDISFLWRAYGIRTFGAEHDTMLLHHALYPESQKSLGFLGSLYTDEGAWKHMRKGTETIKRED